MDEESPTGRAEATDEHLADIADGDGCVEIWERLSERRATED